MKVGRTWAVVTLAVALIVAGCGDDDDAAEPEGTSAAPSAATDDTPAGGDDAPTETEAPPAPAGGGNGGELALGDETITFDSARCYLEEQEAAAGGGKILFVAQAFGTNAAGDQVAIDVSRYDEDSQFYGDDILVDIGDPFSEDAVSLQAAADFGTVAVDGSNLSAGGLTFVNFDDFSELAGSFQISC